MESQRNHLSTLLCQTPHFQSPHQASFKYASLASLKFLLSVSSLVSIQLKQRSCVFMQCL